LKTLAQRLASIGLPAVATQLDDLIAVATKQRWRAPEFFEHIADLESNDRAKRSLDRRLSRSRIARFKPIADFDWAWPKRIDRPVLEKALRLDFLREARNLILLAPPGLGKTTLAKNIAHQAVLAGHSVLFVTAAQLLLDLAAQDSPRALERRLRHYSRSRLSLLRQSQCRPPLRDCQSSLRTQKPPSHYQSPFPRLAHHLPKRRLRHRPHRAPHPPCRRHRNRR
jgi:DNA replication protein DnaC